MKPTKQKITKTKKITNPEGCIAEIFEKIDPAWLSSTFKIDDWTDGNDFLEKVAIKNGKLLKRGEPDTANAARMVVIEWQKGQQRMLKVKLPRKKHTEIVKSVIPSDGSEQVTSDKAEDKAKGVIPDEFESEKKSTGDEPQHQSNLSCKERRAKEKAERAKKSGSNFYEQANAKNRKNRPPNKKTRSTNNAVLVVHVPFG